MLLFSTFSRNSALTNINDIAKVMYLMNPSFFLFSFGTLYGSKSNTIPVQQAYPHHPLPKNILMMEEMNEIHEFMSKFREGVEVIWGVAIDNSLETRVKITVLATGFGVEDVPGMDSLHAARSQDEEERQLQLEEEKEKNKERIRKAYGESASNIGSKSLRKRRHIYLFNTEDLDNDDIIAMVEDSPTYMRDKTTLTKIRTKAALEEEVATEEATDDNCVITF